VLYSSQGKGAEPQRAERRCLPQGRTALFVVQWSYPVLVAWSSARSEDEAAPEGLRQTRQRTHQQAGVSWIGDGRAVYRREIRRTHRDPQRTGRRGRPPLVPTPGVGLTQVVKQRRRGRVVGVEVRPVRGEPVTFPYRVHEERLNGVLRDRWNALTRRTHAFAKETPTWDGLVTVCLLEHNGLRPHPALRKPAESLPNGQRYRRRTPAMVISLTDHVWSWEEFLTLKHYHHQKG